MRRVKVLQVSGDFLVGLFTTGEHPPGVIKYTVENGLPEDAKIVGVFVPYDRFANCLNVLIESDTFEEVEEGAEYPKFSPIIRTQRDTKTAELREQVRELVGVLKDAAPFLNKVITDGEYEDDELCAFIGIVKQLLKKYEVVNGE